MEAVCSGVAYDRASSADEYPLGGDNMPANSSPSSSESPESHANKLITVTMLTIWTCCFACGLSRDVMLLEDPAAQPMTSLTVAVRTLHAYEV